MITTEKIVLPVADIGIPDPLPDIRNNTYIHAPIKTTEKVSKKELPDLNQGMISTMIPYLTQNGYSREKQLRQVDIAVLENRYLRAEFLPAWGGRLRRLYDKEHGRELLYVNPVIQPCNLALRNAWFSGGVEFNVGIKGHNPLTCSPVFMEKRVTDKGEEYLSVYEYERIRGVVWSVNAYLPEDARSLVLRCCIENTSSEQKHMYWWSNIAVDESENARVIVPTDETYINYFGNDSYVLDKAPMPHALNTDISYPKNASRSLDYFYKLPDDAPKWIAAVDGEGKGLLHISSPRLFGRKLFVWGRSQGGRHWAEYLSCKGSGYIEIQAGLARTQLEHFPMKAESTLEWLEAYSAIDIGSAAHGEWQEARAAVSAELPSPTLLYAPELTPADRLSSHELLFEGSGWGALEAKLSGKKISEYFDFPLTHSADAKYFDSLLENGSLPSLSPLSAPVGYVTGDAWAERLKESIADKPTYEAYLQLGVNRYDAYCKGECNENECIEYWESSYALTPNPWALRNLGAFYANEKKDYAKGLEYEIKALSMLPSCRPLAVECGQLLFAAERTRAEGRPSIAENGYKLWLSLCDRLEGEAGTHGRILLLKAAAYIELDMLHEAEQIVNADFLLADIKEGEISISELWFALEAKKRGISLEDAKSTLKLPYSLDFRMH